MDELTGNYCRLVEQEHEEESVVWHYCTVELRLGNVLITGHWQILLTVSLMDWE